MEKLKVNIQNVTFGELRITKTRQKQKTKFVVFIT